MPKKLTQEEFERKVKEVHGDSIDLANAVYRGDNAEVECKCNVCGNVWKAKPNKLKVGHGCHVCGRKKIWKNRNDKTTTESLIKRMQEVFPSYDFSRNKEIKSQKQKITVCCGKHGEFTATPDSILHGHGCRKCQYEKIRKSLLMPKDEVIKKAKEIHGDKYVYLENFQYNGIDKPIEIICPVHGKFKQTPYKHIKRRQGCPICSQSHLEEEIRTALERDGIEFVQKASKNVLPWIGMQHLDFYIPKYNVAIECQGEQHYKPISFNSDKSEETLSEIFSKQQERDRRKKSLCDENGVKVFYFTHFVGINADNETVFSKKEAVAERLKGMEND